MTVRQFFEMTITREEFLRLLPGAVGRRTVSEKDGAFTGEEDGRSWTITPLPMPDHRLGSFSLARLRVELRLDGFTDEESKGFLARFHRGFQRGGG